jgi:hypothetical protein
VDLENNITLDLKGHLGERIWGRNLAKIAATGFSNRAVLLRVC